MSINSTCAKLIAINALGYQAFAIGKFSFQRDEYFVHIFCPGNRHIMHDRRLPSRSDARRRLGLLLRHRQLR